MTLTEVVILSVTADYEGCTDDSTENTNTGTCPDTPRYFDYHYFDVHYFSMHYFTVCKPGFTPAD